MPDDRTDRAEMEKAWEIAVKEDDKSARPDLDAFVRPFQRPWFEAGWQAKARVLQGQQEPAACHLPQQGEPGEAHCPRCGEYMPMRLNGRERVHGCDRTPPSDGLPTTIYACPTCGGHGRSAWGCEGTAENPHPHAYMQPVHELVRAARENPKGP